MKKKRSVSEKVKKLMALLADKRNALIVLQDTPDPDAIGSAVGLKQLFGHSADMRVTIAHGGSLGRAENRGLVEFLGVKLVQMQDIDPASFDVIAMVDTQPGTGNNSLVLDAGLLPHVVIDHHPRRPEVRKVPFVHVDTRYGATSTMITEYLVDQDLTPNKKTATALVYGIKTDTAGLTREARRADREAMFFLYPLHLPEVLARIESEKVPRTYFKDFKTAMEAATIYGKVVFANLNKVQNPDMVGEIADFLLRLEEMNVVLVVGSFEDELVLSCRVDPAAAWEHRDAAARELAEGAGEQRVRKEPAPAEPQGEAQEREASTEAGAASASDSPHRQFDAGAIMKAVVGLDGSGGGHVSMAGGRISLGKRSTRREADDMARLCETRFIEIFGVKRKEKKDLT